MIRHPLTLDLIVRELHTILANGILVTAWTQEKQQATLGFVLPSNEEYYVQINVSNPYGTILTSTSSFRAKRNSIDMFPLIIGQRLLDVERLPGDRVIVFQFENFELRARFFSGGAGNIILEGGNGIVDALHDKKSLLGTTTIHQPRDLVLGPYLATLDMSTDLVVKEYQNSNEYYLLTKDSEILFSALPIPGWRVETQFTNLFDALRTVVSRRRFQDQSQSHTNKASKILQTSKARILRSLDALNNEARHASTPLELRNTATELLSSPNSTKENIQKAQKLFQKARYAETASTERASRHALLTSQLDKINSDIQSLEQGTLPTNQKQMITQKEPSPYREFALDEGFTVFVGRNSANNDQLTMRFAKQNDLWLHVRGQSGSHCVLRSPAALSSKIPKRVLEQAASIAAYYSSARNGTWVPVVYTLRKYVRKPKGAAVGAVTLDREEVIMVKPGLPSGPQES